MVWPRASVSWTGLELSSHPRFDWDFHVLNALSGAMVGVGKAGRKRDPGFVLVLEYRRQHYHVSVFPFPARSGWHPGVFAELDHLHS